MTTPNFLLGDDGQKQSTGRLVLVVALFSLILVYLFVLYRISYAKPPMAFAEYEGFLKSFREGLQWLGLGGYVATKTKETVVERKNGGGG